MAAKLRYLVILTVLFVVSLNFTSAFLRHAKSGLECVDRAVCYEQVGVSGKAITFAADEADGYHFATKAHRVLATIIAFLVLAVNIVLFRVDRDRFPFRRHALAMGAIVLWLAGLGVVAGPSLESWVVMGNLFGGLLLLMVSTLLMTRVFGWQYEFTLKKIVFLAGGVLLFTLFLQGGMVSTNFAGMACTTVPDCNGEWWSGNPLIQMHMMHRFSAAVALLYFGVILLRAFRRGDSGQRNFLLMLLLLLVAQIKLGGLMVEEQLPLVITSIHSTLSQLLITALLVYFYVTGVRADMGMDGSE